MAFKRGDMYFKDYSWTASSQGDNPHYTGVMDDRQVDRQEGYEVLYFVNDFAVAQARSNDTWRNPSIYTYQKVERLLRMAPPYRYRSQYNSWIISNWSSQGL